MRLHTETVHIQADREHVFDYLAEPRNHAEWAVNFLLDLKETPKGLVATTPMGEARYSATADRKTGIVDIHVGPALYPTRVITAPGGAIYTFTLPFPSDLPAEQVEAGIAGLRDELARLKSILEAR